MFPADVTRVRTDKQPRRPHINGESVCRAMARLRERVAKTKLLKDARVHDLRRTVTTWLREERLISSRMFAI